MATTYGVASHSQLSSSLQQLRHHASQCGEDGIHPSPVPGVFESDMLLGEDTRLKVLAGLKPLEDVPEEQMDWHPGPFPMVTALLTASLRRVNILPS